MSTALEQKQTAIKSIAAYLVQKKSKLEVALPKHITADRMIRITLNSLGKSKELLECTQESLWEAIIEAATYGWEIGGPVAQAYLVPYWNSKQRIREAVLIPGYRGLIDLARRSGQIANVAFGVVHEGDKFVPPSDALEPQLIHQHSDDLERHKKPITHVWAGYLFKDGNRVYCVMTAAEIDAHKERYVPVGKDGTGGWKSPKSGWQTAWDAMAIKTCLKRPIMKGQVPIAAEHQRIAMRDEIDGEVASSQVTTVEPEALAFEQGSLPAPETADPGEITEEDEWSLFTAVADARMADAANITQTNEVADQLNSEYVSDRHAEYVMRIRDVRQDEIRANRGPRAKKD